jgi:valyl-tRNA synthetase
MIFSGMEFMKQEPFHTVFINGLIRDSEGRKMSKSLDNGVDPIDMILKYGADALRFNIITGNSPGNDIRFYPERCEAMRNFANKIWNASRFVMMNLTIDHNELPDTLELEDKWILSKLNTLAGEVSDNLDKYELGVAAAKIYDFIWDSYCDWYIELTKPRLQSPESGDEKACGSSDNAINAQKVLLHVLTEILTLLHPFMPFITEEIWQAIPHESSESGGEAGSVPKALMVRQYTKFSDALHFPREEADFESIMAAVRAVRARRADMNVPPSRKSSLTIVTEKPEVFEAGRVYIGRLAYANELTILTQGDEGALRDQSGLVAVVTNDARLYMPLAELVDVAKERERIEKEIAKALADIGRMEQKLSNEQFTSKAPEQVVNTERGKLDKLRALLDNLNDSLSGLPGP